MARKSDDGAELTSDDKFELLLSTLTEALTKQQTGGIDKDALKEILESNTEAIQKAARRENEHHPGISAMRPNGGPDPELPFEFFWFNFPVHKFRESHHDLELALMARVEPGTYTVLRKDLSPMKLEVKGEHDVHGKLVKVMVTMPEGQSMTRDDAKLMAPMAVVLHQIVHPDNPQLRFVEGMQAWLRAAMPATAAV